MSARQLIVLAVAFIAAIGALLVIRGMGSRAEPVAAAAASIEAARVLVAARDIPQGASLAAGDLQWRGFPTDSITPSFVQETAQPSAPTDMAGWVTRRPFAAGEPIMAGSVIGPDGRGFMAAQLRPGYRAVSVELGAETTAGNFIQPNDHVDVVMTQEVETPGSNDKDYRSSVILADVRVLAIGEHVQPAQPNGAGPQRAMGDVVVLELTQADARIIARGEALGDLSLALRGVEVEAPGLRVESAAPRDGSMNERDIGGPVRVHAYGAVANSRGR